MRQQTTSVRYAKESLVIRYKLHYVCTQPQNRNYFGNVSRVGGMAKKNNKRLRIVQSFHEQWKLHRPLRLSANVCLAPDYESDAGAEGKERQEKTCSCGSSLPMTFLRKVGVAP